MRDLSRAALIDRAAYFGIAILGRLASVAAVLLLARALDPSTMGGFAFLQATATIALTLGSLNLGQILNVSLAHTATRRIRRENAILALVLTGVSLLSVAVALTLLAASPGTVPASLNTVLLFAAFVAVTGLQSLVQMIAYARGEPVWAAACAAGSAIVLCAGVLVVQPVSIASALTISTLAIAAGTATLCARLFRAGLATDWRAASRLLKTIGRRHGRKLAAFSSISLVSGVVLQASLWLIQRHLIGNGNAADNATYAIGLQFFNVVLFLPSLYAPLLVRRLSLLDDGPSRHHDVAAAAAACVVICLSGLLVLSLAEGSIIWLVPAKYTGASNVIWWSVLAAAFMFVKFPFSVFFQVRYSAQPDAVANLLAAICIGVGIYLAGWGTNAVASSQLRALACLCQLGCLAVWFHTAKRRSATGTQAA